MIKKQTSGSLPPRISLFDKRARNSFNVAKELNKPSDARGQTTGNAPQFRINQHKGA